MNNLFHTQKVVMVDFSILLHKSIFRFERDRKYPPPFLALQSLLGLLNKIELTPDDIIIIGLDDRRSWRKSFDRNYKANRKALREKHDIDWPFWYAKFDELVERLKESTYFCFLKVENCEFDDLASVACRHYKDKDIIIISTDSDFYQLLAYKNVKIFNPNMKRYVFVRNPYKTLDKKIKCERTDNLLSPILDEADFKKRKMIVNLLELPEEIEKKVLDRLMNLCYNNHYDLEKFPYPSLRGRFCNIFNSEEIENSEPVKKG